MTYNLVLEVIITYENASYCWTLPTLLFVP